MAISLSLLSLISIVIRCWNVAPIGRCKRPMSNGFRHERPIEISVAVGTLLRRLSRRCLRDRQQRHHADGSRIQRTATDDPASGDGEEPKQRWRAHSHTGQQERPQHIHPDRSGITEIEYNNNKIKHNAAPLFLFSTRSMAPRHFGILSSPPTFFFLSLAFFDGGSQKISLRFAVEIEMVLVCRISR